MLKWWPFRKKPFAFSVLDPDFPLMHWLLCRLWQQGHFEGHKIVPIYEANKGRDVRNLE